MRYVAHRNAAQHALRMEWLRGYHLRHFLGTYPREKDRSLWNIFWVYHRRVALDGKKLFHKQTLGIFTWTDLRLRKFLAFQIERQQSLHNRTPIHLPLQHRLPRLLPRLKISRTVTPSMGDHDNLRSSFAFYSGGDNKTHAVNSSIDSNGSSFGAFDNGNE